MHTSTGDYAAWFRARRDALAREIAEEARGFDEATRSLIERVLQLSTLNQTLLTLRLLDIRLEMLENNRQVDDTLNEVAEYMAAILDDHRREADALKKAL